MKLHDALQRLCRESGYIALQKKTLLDQLDGLDAFGEIPEMRDVMREFVSQKCGKELCGRGKDKPSYPACAERISRALASKGHFSRDLARYAADSACFALGLTDSVTVPAAPEPSSAGAGESPDEALPPADRMPESAEEAENCRKLAERGDVHAQLLMGSMCLIGHFTDYDPEAGAGWYRMAARNGFAPAMSSLAGLYVSGFGVRQDYGEAFRWYQKAAEQGFAAGESGLGELYRSGHGTAQNFSEAMKWFRKAADQESAEGEFGIACLYLLGQGVRRDEKKAFSWLMKSAGHGSSDAADCLGDMYCSGRGVTKNLEEAVKWYRKAAEDGILPAQKSLARIYSDKDSPLRDDAEALKWCREAVSQGDSEAENTLAFLYERGTGVSKDLGEALSLYRDAADQGNAEAMANLGRLYFSEQESRRIMRSRQSGTGRRLSAASGLQGSPLP